VTYHDRWTPERMVPWSKLCGLVDKLDKLDKENPFRSGNGTPRNGTAHANGSADRLAGSSLGDRVRKYLAAVPPAVAGQRGHDRTFYAAGRLVRGFDLTPDDALPYFQEWNRRCDPPWADGDLYRKLTEAARQPGPRGFLLRADAPPAARAGALPRLANYAVEEVADGETTRPAKRGRPAADVFDDLLAWTGGWPRACGGMLFVRAADGHGVEWLRTQAQLFAWADRSYGGGGRRGVDWAAGPDCCTKEEFHAYCLANAERYDAAESFPHEPPVPGVFYVHPDPGGGDGSALAGLTARFSPASPADDDLILGLFLTLFWGGPGGQRPLYVFEAADGAGQRGRGAGKSTVPEVAARLCGGKLGISYRADTTEVEKRLLGAEGRAKRMAVIDNVKTLRFSNPDLESMITAGVLSGKQMWVGEGQRPNLLTWVMTFNQPSVSKDIAQRAVLVKVDTPGYTPRWLTETERYIADRRWDIVGDLLALLRRPVVVPAGFRFTRWAAWEEAVLCRLPDPVGLQALLTERRAAIDDDDEQADDVTEAIRDLLRDKFGVGADPDRMRVLVPVGTLFEKVVKKFAPDIRTPHHGTKWLFTLPIPELARWSSRNPYRGAMWTGGKCEPRAAYVRWDDIG